MLKWIVIASSPLQSSRKGWDGKRAGADEDRPPALHALVKQRTKQKENESK